MKKYILALDQGTTGSRAFIFDRNAKVAGFGYKEFKQYYPHQGWVEHDPIEIWKSVQHVIQAALTQADISSSQIISIGITNQRETVVAWDKTTGRAYGNAIVWQCRRTSDLCGRWKSKEKIIRQKTGLLLDPYFSGTKIKWMLDNVKGLKEKAKKGQVCFGTIDSWLIWNLTGAKSFVTDTTNASRTLLFNIKTLKWDLELLGMFKVPLSALPSVQSSGSTFGVTAKSSGICAGIPITGVLGDQQAALYGQGCFKPGSIKNTYGTGCFLVLNTGKKLIRSSKGLLSTIASDINGNPIYALEGAVFIAGAVMQWLRDEMGLITDAHSSEAMIKGLTDTNGVYVVPAFAGLGAPYWNPQARGLVTGLTRGANANHIIRAALESMAYQTKDVFDVMVKDYGKSIRQLKVDGGACQNNFLMQFQADILRCSIIRPKMIDSTVKGAALLAGITSGFWTTSDIERFNKIDKQFNPKMKLTYSKKLMQGWKKSIDLANQS